MCRPGGMCLILREIVELESVIVSPQVLRREHVSRFLNLPRGQCNLSCFQAVHESSAAEYEALHGTFCEPYPASDGDTVHVRMPSRAGHCPNYTVRGLDGRHRNSHPVDLQGVKRLEVRLHLFTVLCFGHSPGPFSNAIRNAARRSCLAATLAISSLLVAPVTTSGSNRSLAICSSFKACGRSRCKETYTSPRTASLCARLRTSRASAS